MTASKVSVADRKEQLEDRRMELLARIEQIKADLDAPLPKGSDDASIDLEDDEVQGDLEQAAIREIRMIDAALKRVEEGIYGYCVRCGDPISEERLNVLPATPFCREDAAGAR